MLWRTGKSLSSLWESNHNSSVIQPISHHSTKYSLKRYRPELHLGDVRLQDSGSHSHMVFYGEAPSSLAEG
jgi:hypothetical protein